MTTLVKQSLLERASGSALTESALTVVAAMAGGPLAALLPVLSNALASERQRGRVEEAILQIDNLLKQNLDAVHHLSDSQYKLVNETILAVLQTTSAEKLSHLQNAVRNALAFKDIEPLEATVLSRIIRDISAEEVVFLAKSFGFRKVQITSFADEDDTASDVLKINLSSPDVLAVSGLVSLGLLASAGSTYEDLGQLRFMPITAKLLALVLPKNT